MDEPEVELPWMDDKLPVSEAIEIVARASMEDSQELTALREQVEGNGASVGEIDDAASTDDLDELRADVDELRADVEELEERLSSVAGDVEALDEEPSGVADDLDDLKRTLDNVRTRVSYLESSAGVECPNCGADGVLKAGVAAAVFARDERLTENNVAALDEAPLVCRECMTAFARA